MVKPKKYLFYVIFTLFYEEDTKTLPTEDERVTLITSNPEVQHSLCRRNFSEYVFNNCLEVFHRIYSNRLLPDVKDPDLCCACKKYFSNRRNYKSRLRKYTTLILLIPSNPLCIIILHQIEMILITIVMHCDMFNKEYKVREI